MVESAIARDNTVVVMVDHAVGLGDVARSHSPSEHLAAACALAQTALTFGLPLVLTNGPDGGPAGPLFPELLAVAGDTPVQVRAGNFDAFGTPEFTAAIVMTGCSKLVLSGLTTEGSVLQTALTGLRLGFEVYLAVDAVAGEDVQAHQAALQRLTQSGARPLTWLSLACELQVTYDDLDTVGPFLQTMAQYSTGYGPFAAAAGGR